MRSKSARPPSISRRCENVSHKESGNSLMTSTIAVTVNVPTSTTTCGTVTLKTLTMKGNQSNLNTTVFVAALISSQDHQKNGVHEPLPSAPFGRSGSGRGLKPPPYLLAPCLLLAWSFLAPFGRCGAPPPRGENPRALSASGGCSALGCFVLRF